MSYVEHGPRIFLAGDSNKRRKNSASNGDDRKLNPLVYGDYVLPRKRSEGRLKAYESCTDIRAWSQNPLDNSHYIRELAEHAKTPGKIVPLNVVIDNVIGLGAKTQNELTACKRELQKYKSLVLTPEQIHQLQLPAPSSPRLQRSRSKPTSSTSPRSEFGATVRAHSASPRRRQRDELENGVVDKSLQTETEDKPTLRSRATSPSTARQLSCCHDRQLDATGSTESRKTQSQEYILNDNLAATGSRAPHPATTNTSDETAVYRSGKEDHDFLSIESTSDGYTADDYEEGEDESEERESEIGSDKERNDRNIEEKRSGTAAKTTRGTESMSRTPGITDTETGTGTETGTASVTDYDTDDENNKATIIQKDSEIIALKNELGAKEAEIEELRDINKLLEKTLNEKDEGIQFLKGSIAQLSEQRLSGIGDEMMYESERLKKKIGICECAISELKGDLKEKVSTCRAQANEIEDLRFRLKEAEMIRVERDSLARKVNEMGDLLVDAEKCARALTEMKSALRERDELRCQNREQSCLLADQEDEIKRLLLLVKRLSAKYEGRQVKMKGAMESMRLEIDEKNGKICECEQQLSAMEKEVGCLNVKLKNSLNSMDEFKIAYQDACNCADLDRDIYSQAKSALCKLNLTMMELKEYKFERENLIRQIEDMKNQIQNNNNKLNKFCCQNPYDNDNRNANEDRRLSEMETLDLRKRRCMLQEELEDLDKELENRMGVNAKAGMAIDEQLDVVASAKQTINRLNNAMLDLDAWECEKASMKSTIERLQIQISTLTGNEEVGGENVERRIVDQASSSLAKLGSLLNELKQYQTERQQMKKEIHNLTEALKDSQAAASCKGVTLLKQRLYDLRLENEKDRLNHAEEVKSLQAKLEEAENTSSCSGVKALRLKLREAQRAMSGDSRIDEVLAIHVKKSIEKLESISKEIEEVDQERNEIVRDLAKRQEEIEVRNVEIIKLRNQMMMEGDRAEEVSETRKQLAMKNGMIQDLRDQVQSLQFQIMGSNQEQSSMMQRIKIVEEHNQKLMIENEGKCKELETKNDEVDSLRKKLNSLNRVSSSFNEIDKQVEEMKPRLISLQTENEKLINEVATLKSVLSERNEEIISLVDERSKHKDEMLKIVSSYDIDKSKLQKDFDRVFRTNKTLTTKLLEAESKISELNDRISSFEADRAELDQISNLQREIMKLTKDKRKLEGELEGFRTQLVNFQTSNKKLDRDLARICSENDSLREEIRNLSSENGRLSSELVGEASAKEQLTRLPDKLNKDIAALKERLQTTESRATNVLQELGTRVEQLQDKATDDTLLINELQRVNKFQNEQALINEEKISVLEKSNNELKSELNKRLDELAELNLRLKKMESDNKKMSDNEKQSAEFGQKKEQILVSDNAVEFSKSSAKKTKGFDKKSISDDENGGKDLAEITCRLNHAENESKQRKTEIQKLQCDLKSKISEINSLREDVKHLTEEREALNEKIRKEEIQNSKRLQDVKMRYEGCLKGMYENHNKSVARLQAQYEEAMKDSDFFDSESWLRSLSLKEMEKLHDRICMETSCTMLTNEHSNSEDSLSVKNQSPRSQRHQQQDPSNDKRQLSRRISNLENEIVQREQEAQQKVYKLERALDHEKKRCQEYSEAVNWEEQRNAELQNRIIMLSGKNQNQIQTTSPMSNDPKTSRSTHSNITTDPNENEKDILRRQSAYNQDRAENYGILLTQQRKISKNLEMELMNDSPNEKVYDFRKKDFIYQCSTYKKT